MMRSCSAALLVLCGLVTTAQAQYTGHYHAPPYNTYAGYAPGGFNGPLRVVDWRWWAGVAPYSPAYAYPGAGGAYTAGYGSAYTAAYSPTAYTASYAPAAYAGYTTTANYFTPSYTSASYYTPSYDSAIAYYPTPLAASANPCCSPCAGTTSYNPNCPGGNCGMNYQPNPAGDPQPDPAMQGSSGAQRYESESDPAPGAGTAPDNGAAPGNDDWRKAYDPAESGQVPPNDGFPMGESEGGANYSPPQTIEKKAPIPAEEEDTPEFPDIEPAPSETPDPAAQDEADVFRAPILDPKAAMPLVNRDSRISNAPSVLPERRRLSARFGSPQLARSKVNPNALPSAQDLKLVQK